MTIQYYITNVYGKETIYLVESAQATAIKQLTGKKTISVADVGALEILGFKLERVFAPTK